MGILALAGCSSSSSLQYNADNEDKAAMQDAMQGFQDHTPNVEFMYDISKNQELLANTETDQTALPVVGEDVVVLDTDKGPIKIKLFVKEAPTLTSNFASLVLEGRYDGVPFHRVIKGFMIQTGDYTNGDGTGGASATGQGLADEYADNLSHIAGAVAMAKSSLPNSIGSQFYIVHEDSTFLDDNYSIIGQVIEGMDIVDEIANVEVEPTAYGEMSSPVEPITVKKAYIETYGEEDSATNQTNEEETTSNS